MLVSDVRTCYYDGSCDLALDAGPAVEMLAPRCPSERIHIDGGEYSWISADDQSRLPDRTWRCEQSLPVKRPDPKSCMIGNPVHPTTGLKLQIEADYVGLGNSLAFARTYRNDTGSFGSIPNTGLVDNTVTRILPSKCVLGTYIDSLGQIQSHCFQQTSSTQYSYSATDLGI